jgi:hypothetical protein
MTQVTITRITEEGDSFVIHSDRVTYKVKKSLCPQALKPGDRVELEVASSHLEVKSIKVLEATAGVSASGAKPQGKDAKG